MPTIDTTTFWQMPGVWIAALGGAFMLLNTVRSLSNPVTFAAYLGLPLADDRDAGMVRVYALRALFIAVTMAGLLIIKDVPALTIITLAATIMAFGDAVLTSQAGAARGTVMRHVIIGVVLLVGGLLLLRG